MGVYRRPDTGVWEFRKMIRGVKYYEALPEARTPLQAEIAAGQVLQKIYEGKYGREGQEIGSTDFVKFCKEVFLPDIKERLKVPKHEEYKVNMLCRHKLLKGKRLKDINLMLIQKLRRERLDGITQFGRPRKASTVRSEISTLSMILDMAIECELLGLNPCRKLKWNKRMTKSERDRILSEEEEARLMAQLERFPEARDATTIALNTGLRRMGILLRKVSDVNFQKRTLDYIAKGGKKRIMPLNSTVWPVFERLVERADANGFLFHVRTGNNLSHRAGAFQLSRRRAGIEDLHFHDLRHTFSTRVSGLTDAFTVRELMAHEDVDTTNIYVTPQFGEMRRAVESLCQTGKVLEFNSKTG